MTTLEELKIKEEDFKNRQISELPDKPSEAGMSAEDLKNMFDAAAKHIIMPAFNALIDYLMNSGADDINATDNGQQVVLQELLDTMVRFTTEDTKYIRVNENNRLEASSDGAFWEVIGSGDDVTAKEIGAVPENRKVNGKELKEDITLTADDVKALPIGWTPDLSALGAASGDAFVSGGSFVAMQNNRGGTWYRIQLNSNGNFAIYQSTDSGATWTNKGLVYSKSNPPTAFDVGALPYKNIISEGTSLTDIFNSGAHYGFYYVDRNKNAGTPYEEGVTGVGSFFVFSMATSVNNGIQVAFPSGSTDVKLFMRTKTSGIVGKWTTGFLPLTGGTLTGGLYMQNATSGRELYQQISNAGNLNLFNRVIGDSDNQSLLQLKAQTASLIDLLRLERHIDGDSNIYKVYGTHVVTCGTTDLTSGSSALGTDCIYQKYE